MFYCDSFLTYLPHFFVFFQVSIVSCCRFNYIATTEATVILISTRTVVATIVTIVIAVSARLTALCSKEEEEMKMNLLQMRTII